jgi:hypothetical protein
VIEKRLENYLEQIYDTIQEQLSFEDSINGLRESDFENAYYIIENALFEYKDKIDFINFLNIPEENEEVKFEESIIDISPYVEILINNYELREKIKNINPSVVEYFNDKNLYYLNYIVKRNIDLNQYKEEIYNIDSDKNAFKFLHNIILKNKIENISELFNKDSLNKNNVFNHYKNLMYEEYHSKLNKVINKEDIHYNHHRFIREIEYIDRPYVESVLTFKKYKHLYNNHKNLNKKDPDYFNILEQNDLEKIDDFFQKVIEKNQIKNYAKRFLGSYLKLMDEESYNIFKLLKEKDISSKEIRKQLSKIALYEDSSILNYSLNKILENKKDTVNSIVEIIKENNLNAEIIMNNELLVIQIKNFEASKNLGLSRWCISTSQSYYDKYLNSQNLRHHIFVYDFNKEETNPEHKFAFTIDSNGEISAAFDNRDYSIIERLKNGKVMDLEKLSNIKMAYIENNEVDNILKNKKEIDLFLLSTFYNPVDIIKSKIDLPKIEFNNVNNKLIDDIIDKSIKNKTVLSDLEQINQIFKFSKKLNINPLKNKNFEEKFERLNEFEKILIKKQYEEIIKENKKIIKNN